MENTPPKKEFFGWRIALAIGAMILLVLVVSEFYQRMTDLRRLSIERDLVSNRLLNQKETEAAVKAAIAYAASDRAVEEWARKYGKMKKEGDVSIGVIAPSASTPTPTPLPTAMIAEKTNPQKWIDLIFGIQTRISLP